MRSVLYGRDCKACGACSTGEIVKRAERALWEKLLMDPTPAVHAVTGQNTFNTSEFLKYNKTVSDWIMHILMSWVYRPFIQAVLFMGFKRGDASQKPVT